MTKLDKALTDKTRAIIPVHLFGQPADMGYLSTLIGDDIKVIEDACESAFARYLDVPVGSWGDIGVFSFYVAHLLTTGVGGIGVTNNPDYAAKMRSIVNHGRDGIYMSIDTEATKEVIERRFSFETVGHSYRITELEAALGLAQLESYKKMLISRLRNAALLSELLEPLDSKGLIQVPVIMRGVEHSWMMYPIVLRNESKWELVNHLEQNGIETREMLPLTNQPCYRGLWNPDDYPVAQWINESGLYLGCHQDVSAYDVERIVEVIHGYFS
jgi:dTDP-4-amino-4,6-dideoxygalactose transaminase